MNMKKAILLVIDGVIKVIFGTCVKNIKLEDVHKKENEDFLKKMFSEYEVVTFDGMSNLSSEDFYQTLSASVPEPVAAKPVSPAVLPKPKVTQKPKDNGIWVRSKTLTTIILDDILTNNISTRAGRNGEMVEIRLPAIIPAGRAINLANFDQEVLRKSRSLRALLENKDIVRCTEEEAKLLERKMHEKEEQDRTSGPRAVSSSFIDESDGPRSKAQDIELGDKSKPETVAEDVELTQYASSEREEPEPETIDDFLRGT
jgi:hypothetical protein